MSAPLRMDDLAEYIRSYNKTNAHRLHIWTATPRPGGLKLPSELTIRFTIRDVVTVYLTIGCVLPDSIIVVEGATAFGPREKVRFAKDRTRTNEGLNAYCSIFFFSSRSPHPRRNRRTRNQILWCISDYHSTWQTCYSPDRKRPSS